MYASSRGFMEGSFRETALRNYGEIISGRAVVSFFFVFDLRTSALVCCCCFWRSRSVSVLRRRQFLVRRRPYAMGALEGEATPPLWGSAGWAKRRNKIHASAVGNRLWAMTFNFGPTACVLEHASRACFSPRNVFETLK